MDPAQTMTAERAPNQNSKLFATKFFYKQL